MKSIILFGIMIATLGIGVIEAKPTNYPPCSAQQPAILPATFCRPRFFGGELVGVRPTLPFA